MTVDTLRYYDRMMSWVQTCRTVIARLVFGGGKRMARSPLDIISTIGTGTRATILWKTWSAWLHRRTPANILENPICSSLSGFDHWRRYGIDLRWDGNGIVNTPKSADLVSQSRFDGSVPPVARLSMIGALVDEADSARIVVNPLGDGDSILTMNNGVARPVAESSTVIGSCLPDTVLAPADTAGVLGRESVRA